MYCFHRFHLFLYEFVSMCRRFLYRNNQPKAVVLLTRVYFNFKTITTTSIIKKSWIGSARDICSTFRGLSRFTYSLFVRGRVCLAPSMSVYSRIAWLGVSAVAGAAVESWKQLNRITNPLTEVRESPFIL